MRRIARLLRYARPHGLAIAVSVLLMAVVGALTAVRTLLIRPIIDAVLKPGIKTAHVLVYDIPHTHIHMDLQIFLPSRIQNVWTVVALLLVGSTVVKNLCDYAGTLLASRAGFGIVTDLRNELYESLLSRSTAFFQHHATGTLTSTLINDVERVQVAMSAVLSDFLQQLFTLIFMVFAAIFAGGRLAWLLLLFVPVIVTSARRIGRGVRQTTRRGQDRLAEIQNLVHETVTGNGIVKAFGMERWEIGRFHAAAQRLLQANMRSVAVQSISSPLMDALGSVAIALLLLFGREHIKSGDTPGSFIMFVATVMILYDPVRKLPVYWNSFQQAVGASEEIFRFIDASDEVVERPSARPVGGFKDAIEFRQTGFSYERDGRSRAVLHEVSLTIRRGEIVAFVGPSGAGKSTLVNLLPRFYDVGSGAILLDGVDLRDLKVSDLRSQVGKVTQETVLFNDTVRNNIAYGRPDVPMERIESAARAALAHDFILRLPHGYDTVIGERGTRLSGGERQRLAIARALVKDAPILILDEATSALDTESERAVSAALENLMEDRTVLVIAHRLSTVRRADRIVVLEAGRITETGTHEQLLARDGTYRRLYRLQFHEDDPPLDAAEGVA